MLMTITDWFIFPRALSSHNPAMLLVFFLLLVVLVFTSQTYIVYALDIASSAVRIKWRLHASLLLLRLQKRNKVHFTGGFFLYLYLCLCVCVLLSLNSVAVAHLLSCSTYKVPYPARAANELQLAATDTFLNHKFCPRADLGRIICF